MKKAFVGLFIIVAILSTGCLGDAPEQIIGTWRTVVVNPNTIVSHQMQWQFQDNGQVFITDLFTLAPTDTGKYELYMSGTHRIVKISGTDIADPNIPQDGEWYIVRIDYDNMVLGTRDYGGFIQRDFTR